MAYIGNQKNARILKKWQKLESFQLCQCLRDQFYLLQLRVWGLSLSIKIHFSSLLHFEPEVGYNNRRWQLRIFVNSSTFEGILISTGGVRNCASPIVY